MTNKDPGIFWRGVITVIGLAVATVMVSAVPAWAHPVFSTPSRFRFPGSEGCLPAP